MTDYNKRYHPSNKIHPTAIVDEGVKIGIGNYIGPYCYITNNTLIGDNCTFEAYCSVGTNAEHKSHFHKEPKHKVVICDNGVFREFITINVGIEKDTFIGPNIIMLRGSHVGHDSEIGHNVTLSCNVIIGGHTKIMEGVNMGLGSICHQYATIGAYSMVGMGAIITKKILMKPGGVWVGNPARFIKPNVVGLEINNITSKRLTELTSHFLKLAAANE